MIFSKFAVPSHGIVYVTSEKSLAIVKTPDLPGRRMELFLISDKGFELSNLCNLKQVGIVDAAPMLKKFVETILHSCPYDIGDKGLISFSIGAALLDAANKVLNSCEKFKRIFPWNVLCPDLCLFPIMESFDSTPSDAYDQAYRNFSELLVKRDISGYMTEIARSDEFNRNPSKFVIPRPTLRTSLASKTQSSLRTYVKNESSGNEPPKFVEGCGTGNLQDDRAPKKARL